MKRDINLIWVIIILPTIFISCLQQPADTGSPEDLIIYPSPPAKTRIQYLTSYSTSSDFSGKQTGVNKFLFGDESPLPIVKPYGIAVHKSKIYICDTGIGGIIIMDLNDKSFKYFIPGGRGKLKLPINCDLDYEGNLYVADGNRRQIIIFDPELNYLRELSLDDNSRPTDVEVDSSNIWITAPDNHNIHVYNRSDLSLKNIFPKASLNEKEYLYQPINISLSDKYLYVTDVGECKIKIFDHDMNFISSFGGSGAGLGQFTRPKGLASDREGNIYAVDAAFENVQIFNQQNELLLYFGGTYAGPGGMWLPADVEIDYNNIEFFSQYVDSSFKLEYLIFVSNQYGPDRISVYGFVGLTE